MQYSTGDQKPSITSFGACLRATRKAKGVGLRELARRIRISPAYLSKIETCAWRINGIKRLSEFGTSLGSASAIGTNRDQFVIPFLPQAVPARALPAQHAFDGRYSNVEN